MKKIMRVSVLVGLVGMAVTGWAQTPKGYAIGDAVADFRLTNVDGRSLGLADYRANKGVIVVFLSNHCPFSKAYEDRVIALDRRYAAQGYAVLAIQPNDPAAYEEDSFENMKARARDRGYSFPYLTDDNQAVARAFGATRTPQVFVLKHSGERFVLEYSGTLDDSPQDAGSVQHHYVEDALNALLANRPIVTTTTKPIGCGIKWRGN